ncbi:hypothetical protein [Pseudomonas sp. stari2]|uniref:hypothetical protein n=1 Tax=Pseudomonas sp. Stari2 TaxID=2954814 RepID=UPI00345D1C29
MRWPTIDQVRSFTVLPSGYTWDYLSHDEIDVATVFFKTWFPSISVGSASSFMEMPSVQNLTPTVARLYAEIFHSEKQTTLVD